MLAKFAKPAGCESCQLHETGAGFTPPTGPYSPLLFIGESSGYNEAMEGIPFVGAAGAMLDRIFRRSSVAREQVRIANCVSCRPPGDWLDGAPWQHSAITSCRQYLQPVLENEHVRVVVTLGAIPLRSVLDLWGVDGVRVQDFHGTVHRDPSNRFWVVPTYHPSHLQRGAINLLDVVRFDLGVAQQILRTGSPLTRPVSLLLDPPVTEFAAWVAGFLRVLAHDPQGIYLDTDIETPDKEGGRDEGELTTEDQSTTILRVNFGYRADEGVTVPYLGPYIPLIHQLLASGATLRMWNKGYDEPRLRLAGHDIPGEVWDLMWLAKHLQSDLPLGLGFWAPFYSNYGAWKHLGKIKGKEAEYAAVDGLQTHRVGNGLIADTMREGLWDAFYRHTHLREQYVLRPAHLQGCPISEPRLDAFHEKLQKVSAQKLERINDSNLTGSFKPKAGYRVMPEGDPPESVIGKSGKKGDQAKQDYILNGTVLVQREVEVEISVCQSCGRRSGIGPKHNCLRHKKQRVRKQTEGPDRPGDPDQAPSGPVLDGDDRSNTGLQVPLIVRELSKETRWFWKLPFNPDASQQILKFIKDSGETPGRQKKTKKETGDKATLKKLAKKTGNPVYQDLLDYKAVKKVDSTYALGAKKRIWKSDNRIHPSITFRPSMFRDSCVNPNIQNCVREGTLIEVVRDCSRDPAGIPIELVRVGDWVYSYDENSRLSLQRVSWAGQSGIKPVIRVHWKGKSQRPRHGYLDLTADHLVRLTTGDYRATGQLKVGDRLLSLHRSHGGDGYETLYATGHKAQREHQFVWESLTHRKDPHVHHKNENKRDNRPTNLQGMEVGQHFRGHNTAEGNARWRTDYKGTTKKERAQEADRTYKRRKKIHNHVVVAIELLDIEVPVYDLTVENTHNFIAGELCVHNCIADKEGKSSLAAGFRSCIVADPGYRLCEVDFGGIEGIDTGWMSGDPNYIRLATLGVHAYLTSYLLVDAGKLTAPAELSWSDDDLSRFFADIKKRFPLEYDKAKRVVHGNNYGLTPFGMVENFPEVYPTLKDAEKVQDLYYALCPKLPDFHMRMRDYAYEHETLGGSYVDDYTLLTRGGNHPFAYRHKFFGVQSYRPLNQTQYRKLQWIAQKRMKRDKHPRVRIINGRPFEVVLGEDSKRVVAFFPQSIAAGTLKEAELALFHPDSPYYIGEIADGKTPLIAPIHDSLLLHVPDHMHEWVVSLVIEVMRRPIPTMPCPVEWNIGSHIRVNVAVKVGPVGGSWEDVETIKIPDMAPATAMESGFMPEEPQDWEDFTDLGTQVN